MSDARVNEDARYGCGRCKAVFRTGFARCPIDGEPLRALVNDPLEGSTFADRYVIEELVGEGAMGRVYRARHQRVSRQFAIKVLFGDHTTDDKMRERFAREAETASRLQHPNVISVVDFGEDDSLLYLVMDFVEGRELEDAIADEAPMQRDRIAALLRQLCLGLEHAHDEGLVHRDFKGANVILTEGRDGEVARIVDFGLAVMSEVVEADRITTDGIVFGTPAYMAPEQATGQELDHRTDLFALGVVLYEMLCGVGPFEGSPIAIARQNIVADPPPIAERVPGLEVDPVLESIAMKLMAKKPEARFQSAGEVIAALEAGGASAAAAEAAIVMNKPEPEAEATEAEAPKAETAVVARADRDDAPGRPIFGLVLAGLIALVIVGGSGFMLWRTIVETRADAAAAPDAGLASSPDARSAEPVATPDAASTSTAPVEPASADAAPAAVTAPEHKPVGAPPVTRPAPRPDAAPTPAKAPVPEPPEVVDQATLTELYNRVNRQISELAAERGDAAAAGFWSEYEGIVVNDAIRNPALRTQYMRKLRSIQRRVRRASQ